MSSRSSIAKIVFVVTIAALAACTSTPKTQVSTALDDAVTVGSFDFPESALLGEIYSQAIESKGFEVDRHFGIGPRELVLPALAAGFIEFVPEYLGTAEQFLSLGAAAQRGDASSSPPGARSDAAIRQPGRARVVTGPGRQRVLRDTSATADRTGCAA